MTTRRLKMFYRPATTANSKVALKLHDMVEIWEIKSWPSLSPILLLLPPRPSLQRGKTPLFLSR